MLWPWTLSLYLQRCLERGELKVGLAAAERQLQQYALSGDFVFDSEVRRLYGELLLAHGGKQAEAAGSELNLALEIAREKQVKPLELRAVMSLARLWMVQGKVEQARERLAEIYDWFTEGFDTADLVAARELLDALQ
jgi:ATP/maltotriose-dependent transcriptional regulator MalT